MRTAFDDPNFILTQAGRGIQTVAGHCHMQRELRASIKLTGFEAGSAHGQQLTSTTLYSVNDEVRPDAVIPADFDLKVKGSAFEYVFPKASVTVIELARR